MDSMTIIAVASIIIAGITTGFGCMGPALAQGKAVATALSSLLCGLDDSHLRQPVLEPRYRSRREVKPCSLTGSPS